MWKQFDFINGPQLVQGPQLLSRRARRAAHYALLATLVLSLLLSSAPVLYAAPPLAVPQHPPLVQEPGDGLKSVLIAGPETGETGTKYNFEAQVDPKEQAESVTYAWSPDPKSGQGTALASYTWNEAGKQEIKVTATGGDGTTVSAEHEIGIENAPARPVASASMTLSAEEVSTGMPVSATLVLTPLIATDYSVFWSPRPSQRLGDEQAVYDLLAPGEQMIEATIVNADGSEVVVSASVNVNGELVTPGPTVSPEPTDEPTTEPTDEPTTEPTDEPTTEPTDEPTTEPTDEPTTEPTDEPTTQPGTTPQPGETPVPTQTPNPSGDDQIFLPLVSSDAEVNSAAAAAPDIIGGQQATAGEWPWQVALIFNQNNPFGSQFCGGSLIDPYWVLTAAHCVDWWNSANTLHIISGQQQLSGSGGEIIAVSQIIAHPDYDNTPLDSDIALLQLSQPASAAPVSLAPVSFSPGNLATVTGWGNTAQSGNASYPNDLMEVQVPLVSNQACVAAYGSTITNNMLCAGQAGVDSCQGDSGGPLVLPNGNGGWAQIGVVSFGRGCGLAGSPGVYARVSQFTGWIAQQQALNPPSSTPDAFEPDNNAGSASPIATDGTAQTHTIHVADDVDWIAFSVTGGVEYTVETSNLGPAADTIIRLYDGATSFLEGDDDGGVGLASRLQFVATQTATYYIEISHYNSSAFGDDTTYDVSITAQEPAALGDQYEPDNIPSNASTIATDGTPQTHNIHVAGDYDEIRFDTVPGTTYIVETFNLGNSADTYLELFGDDVASTPLLTDDDGGSELLASRVEFTAMNAGPYYARVRHYSPNAFGDDTLYDIRVTTTAVGAVGDVYEPDNSISEASSLAADGTLQTHDIHVAGDTDWIGFNATTGVAYTIETSNLGPDADTVIDLVDNFGGVLATDDDGAVQAYASRLNFVATYTGLYYVQVRHYNPAFFSADTFYDIGVTVSSNGSDAFEPDNSRSEAKLIALDGTPQTHNIHVAGDVDWIRLMAAGGAAYTVETFNLGPDADTVIELLDLHGNFITSDDDGGNGVASRLDFFAGYAGPYYVKVRHFNSTASGTGTSYDIRITPTVGSAPDAYEPDGSDASASLIGTDGTAQTHTMHLPGDKDWIRFNVTAGVRYEVKTFNLSSGADTVVGVRNQNLEYVNGNDDGGDEPLASRVPFVAATSGTYYARVQHYDINASGADTQYDVSVSAVP